MAKRKVQQHNDAIFKKTFEEGFKKQFQRGLLQGSKAMCKVVYDKVTDESKEIQERIDEVKRFCGVLLGMNVIESEQYDAKETTEDSKPE